MHVNIKSTSYCMRTTMKSILIAVLAVLAIPLLAAPQALWAAPTADENFIMELKERGIPHPTPDAEAINLAHTIVDGLIQNPTMHEVSELANALLVVSKRQGAPMTVQHAASYIRLSVHYYGPPWLEETLDQQSRSS